MNRDFVNRRFELGILFNFQASWMGGNIYLINIVKTLDFLDDKDKPKITIFYNTDLTSFIDKIEYPYLEKVEWKFPSLIAGNLKSWLLGKNIFTNKILENYSLDAVYPLQDFPVRINSECKLVAWCADFQPNHYPEFFSKKQIIGRNIRVNNILKNSDHLVLSSNDAHQDLVRFFKVPKNLQIHIFHFVSILEDQEDKDINELRTKYELPERYFLVSNQFHKHKNHKIILESLVRLNEEGIKIHVAFTGKFPSATDSPYMSELHQIIDQNRLQDQISMLGIISRNDQLQLMKFCQAVIQPSLFEGWSTVIEDARSLQVPVIASNLGVNIEQLGRDHVFFDPNNVNELSAILKDYPERDFKVQYYEDYTIRVKDAAQIFMNILRS